MPCYLFILFLCCASTRLTALFSHLIYPHYHILSLLCISCQARFKLLMLLLSYAFIAFSALLIFPSYLQLMSIWFHISDTSLYFSLPLSFSALHLPDAFFTCLFLVVFPTVKFVFITRVFLQRLACLICCLFISLLLTLFLSVSVFIFIFICEMSGKARQARGCRSVICRHRLLCLFFFFVFVFVAACLVLLRVSVLGSGYF